jgi:ABC-type lipoprotein release transport system permease subunit
MRTGGMDSRGYDFARIVGIVGDVRHWSRTSDPFPTYYLAYPQRTDRIGTMTLIVRAAGDPRALAQPVRDAVRQIDADVPVDVRSFASRAGESVADRRFLMLLLVAFAVTALALAAIGIYGVVAASVAQRTREIGIRVALGSAAASVLWLVGRRTILGVALGLAAGLAGAAALSRLLVNLLYGVDPLDATTFACVGALLFGVAAIAAFMPARRATRVDPMVALRAE